MSNVFQLLGALPGPLLDETVYNILKLEYTFYTVRMLFQFFVFLFFYCVDCMEYCLLCHDHKWWCISRMSRSRVAYLSYVTP